MPIRRMPNNSAHKLASVSSTSGRPYLIRFKDGTEQKSGEYLQAVLEKIANTKDFQDFDASVTEYEKVPFFTFDNEAQETFKLWLIANEKKIANEPDNAMKEHLAKFPDLFARLCLIFHVLELAENAARNQGEQNLKYVPARHAKMAVQWCDYLESHARRIYAHAKTAGFLYEPAFLSPPGSPSRCAIAADRHPRPAIGTSDPRQSPPAACLPKSYR